MIRRKDQSGEKLCRSWYLPASAWVTDLPLTQEQEEQKAHASNKPTEEKREEFVVPADEYFTRCPISNEIFEQFWDQAEGEFMYRNAMKVLTTEPISPDLFKMGQPSPEPGVRYIIVHKLLVFDLWLKTGRVDTLKSTLQLRGNAPGFKSQLDMYLRAAGDQDLAKVYVLVG